MLPTGEGNPNLSSSLSLFSLYRTPEQRSLILPSLCFSFFTKLDEQPRWRVSTAFTSMLLANQLASLQLDFSDSARCTIHSNCFDQELGSTLRSLLVPGVGHVVIAEGTY